MRNLAWISFSCAVLMTACGDTPAQRPDVPLADVSSDLGDDAAIDVTTADVAPDAPPEDLARMDAPTVDVTADVPPADVPREDVRVDVPVLEGGTPCTFPGYGACARGTECTIARCADGTLTRCSCSPTGETACTGQCPPVSDGGLTCGVARATLVRPPCPAATPTLDPAICRCILGYVWNGSTCVSLSNCHCYAGCDELYDSIEQCRAAHAHCRET